jgi:membrane-associated phospholipid phosphatase
VSTIPASLLLPHERAQRRRRALAWTLAGTIGLLVLTFFDAALWELLKVDDPRAFERQDWYQVFRQSGSLVPWLIVAAALWFHDRTFRRARLLTAAVVFGGAASEGVQLLTKRHRPGIWGDYAFAWQTHDLPNGHLVTGIGMASSHAGVAFGAAFMLAYLFPRAAPVGIALAVGCSITRIAMGAHFITDIYVAALLSYAVVAIIRRLDAIWSPRATA